MRKMFILLIIPFLFLGFGCEGDTGNITGNSFGTDGVDWLAEHTHESVIDDFTAVLNIWLTLDNDTSISDVSRIEISSARGDQWNFNSADLSDLYSFYDNDFWFEINLGSDSNPSASSIAAGNYQIDTFFTDGTTDMQVFELGLPGSLSAGSIDTLYAYNNLDSHGTNCAALMPLAESLQASFSSATTFQVSFTINSSVADGAYLIMYDSSGDYIGKSNWVNNIGSFSNNGSINSYSIGESSFDFYDSSYSISDIAAIEIVVVDGGYDLFSSYYHRSISANTTVTQ